MKEQLIINASDKDILELYRDALENPKHFNLEWKQKLKQEIEKRCLTI